jgi:undecaprenyl phosphate-alpha-L-ara4FN deformylase
MQGFGGIRADVDSIGDIEALPKTLDLLDEARVKATFFVTMGPDRAGGNLFRYLKNPLSLEKAKPARFGFINLVRGLVRPAHMENYKSELYEIKKRGHEVGLHGYDHCEWIKTKGGGAKDVINRGRALFESVFDCPPRSFASPGFMYDHEVLRKVRDFDYSSDFIEKGPLYPRIIGMEFSTLQVPVSIKSIGDFEMAGVNEGEILEAYKNEIERKEFFTFYFHPSYEIKYKPNLVKKIIGILKEKKEVLTFSEIAKKWKDENSSNL